MVGPRAPARTPLMAIKQSTPIFSWTPTGGLHVGFPPAPINVPHIALPPTKPSTPPATIGQPPSAPGPPIGRQLGPAPASILVRAQRARP
jgi:hypothetical protein